MEPTTIGYRTTGSLVLIWVTFLGSLLVLVQCSKSRTRWEATRCAGWAGRWCRWACALGFDTSARTGLRAGWAWIPQPERVCGRAGLRYLSPNGFCAKGLCERLRQAQPERISFWRH